MVADEYDGKSGEELEALAEQRGVAKSGTKAEVAARLREQDAAQRQTEAGPVAQGVAVPPPADAVDQAAGANAPPPFTPVTPVSGSELPDQEFQRYVE